MVQYSGSAALLVVHDGKVRLERYGLGFDGNGRWTSFSVAKSITSTLVGAALRDGHIRSMDDKVSDYIPQMKGSAYDDVSIRRIFNVPKRGLGDRSEAMVTAYAERERIIDEAWEVARGEA